MKGIIQIAGVIDKEEAIMLMEAGVDAHTGVESKNGRKSYELVKKFVEESKEGFVLVK
ncbi:MAG: hypothetical protein HY963_09365 [Ignavibacteriales bacterium]|nr:hypothetical protein [Ignavibacteriales bacterium]